MYDDIGGHWVTIGGRHIFIKNGVDLKTAMIESGKFKRKKKEEDDDEYNEKNTEYIIDDRKKYIKHNDEKIEYLSKKEYDISCQALNNSINEDQREILNGYVTTPAVAGSCDLNEINKRNMDLENCASKDMPSMYYYDLPKNRTMTGFEFDKRFIDVYNSNHLDQLEGRERSDKIREIEKTIVYEDDRRYNRIEEVKDKVSFYSNPENVAKIKEIYQLNIEADRERDKGGEGIQIAENKEKRIDDIVTQLNENNNYKIKNDKAHNYYIVSDWINYTEYKDHWWLSEDEQNNAPKLNYKQVMDQYKENRLEGWAERTRENFKKDFENQQRMDNIFKEKGITFDKPIILYRRSRESAEEIKEGFTKYGYLSTTYKDSLPKKMPSGVPFGDKELMIIVPAGTKMLPLRGIIESKLNGDPDDDRTTMGVARQNEVLLPRESYFKYVTYNWETGRYIVVLEGGNK